MLEITLSITAIIISIISLVSSLRKKEFGKFLFIQKEGYINEVWIKLIKSNIYDIEFHFIDNIQPKRIKMLSPDSEKDVLLRFESSKHHNFKYSFLNENTIIKITTYSNLNIKILFTDKFNNRFYQVLNSQEITDRKQLNPLNLTFGDS
ncbi:MAG: hypothetical protein K9G37_12035 [Crocinitomicaceae bacterium]|nr:hypothetical protein [Crocinitomicaceae bacterium]